MYIIIILASNSYAIVYLLNNRNASYDVAIFDYLHSEIKTMKWVTFCHKKVIIGMLSAVPRMFVKESHLRHSEIKILCLLWIIMSKTQFSNGAHKL